VSKWRHDDAAPHKAGADFPGKPLAGAHRLAMSAYRVSSAASLCWHGSCKSINTLLLVFDNGVKVYVTSDAFFWSLNARA
jgi:hypothetical protein